MSVEISRPTHVALLRGINVGGRNRLPMQAVRSAFEASGCSDVRSYIQSGNVLYRAGPARARRVPALVAAALAERHDLRVPVVQRTVAELRAVARANPFLGSGADTRLLHVVFLARRPAASRVAALEADRSPPDEFRVVGREIYLRCPDGMARTKLTTAWFDSSLATTGTVRNWATVLKLLELAEG